MPKSISDETVQALVEVLDYVWDDGKKHIVEEFEEADDAVKAWNQRDGEGYVFNGVVGDVLTAWEEICGETAEQMIRDLY
jgi:hypothetical protein